MTNVTLYTSNDEGFTGPEGELCWAPLAEYDPHDPESLERAREAVRDHFSLPYLPVLCNKPEPSLWDELVGAARRWLSRKAPSPLERTAREAA